MAAITLTPAARDDEALLQTLFQLYTHDFSEFWAGTDRGDLGPDGRFPAYPLDDYWTRPGWEALLIGVDGVLAGFALVNDVAHSGEPVDANVAEFFVLRKHRGGGVGRAAARAMFARHPGRWEAAVVRRNLAALAFWRRVTAEAGAVEELDLADERWNGPLLRFVWAAG